MKELWIFVEGGGGKDSKDELRRAFSEFLEEPREAARGKGVHWRIVMCGSRDATYKAFRNAVRDFRDALVFLLVDAEREVSGTPRAHLAARDPWDLSLADDDQCHLMAQVMESWFLADPDALARFYGPQFGIKQIPPRNNVEEVPKSEVEAVLKSSTAKTSKGEYHKIRHGAPLLESLNAERVRSRAPHCNRLFEALQEAIG